MIKHFTTIILVFVSFINIILYVFFEDHNRFEGLVAGALMVILLVVYEIWYAVTYYDPEE
jgi:ABC-type polysaccharide/polyol phosphate export permease